MAGVSRYSPRERQEAVARAFGGDERPADVARELGVHATTLYRWAERAARVAPEDEALPTDARLIEAVGRLLREQDYGEITMEDVAAESGVALRTAFHRFAGKRELFNATIDHVAGALTEQMYAYAEDVELPASPLERLRVFMHLSAEVAYALPEAHVLFRDLGVPPARSTAPGWHDRLDAMLAELLTEAEAAGELAPGVAPAAAARILGSGLRGIHAAVFEGADPAQSLYLVDRLHLVVVTP
jgi:AcrR family transcriptional regulator